MKNSLDACDTSAICQIFEIVRETTCILIIPVELYVRLFHI